MRVWRKFVGLVVAVAMVLVPMVVAVPVYADNDNCVETSIIGGGSYCDDGEGSGVYQILNIILNVLLVGIGILGVLGIVISGIQYLTAADNEQQMATAKKRIVEVVIGLAIYAVMYVALQWLIPGGIFNSGS